jgi:hypothetical protein
LVTAEFAPAGCVVIVTVVNTAELGVVNPMLMLLIEPVVVGPIVTCPVPVGLRFTLAFAPVTLTAPIADKLVNCPVFGVVAPILMLLIVPSWVGPIVSTPLPVGAMVILLFALENVTSPVMVNVEKVPALGVVAPITTLSKDPVVAGLTVNVLLTDRLGIVPLVANDNVFVVAFVVIASPFELVRFNVLFDEFKAIVFWPETAR